MAINYYDEAITKKIQGWIKDPNLKVLSPQDTSRLFEIKADQNNDQPLSLPLIAISRDPSVSISIPTKRSLTCDGLKLDGTPLTTVTLEAIPIELNYQIDIYTRFFDEGSEYLRQFVFSFINHPKMVVSIPYNGSDIQHICYTSLDSTLTDNSSIPEKLFSDEFTRWTIQLSVNDAYLFSVPVKQNARIIQADLDMTNAENSLNEIETILNEEEIKEFAK